MADTLFLIFSVLTVACSALVVLNRNAVNAALFLLVAIVGMAGLFVLLDAGLLAVILMFVYGGAVVALFLFIIMLLDTTPGAQKPFKKLTIAASLIGAALIGTGIYMFFDRAVLPESVAVTVPPLKHYAELLFTTYLLPVQVVGFLLLIAMLGVIVLSKKFDTTEAAK